MLDELRKPLDVDAVAQGARTPEQAAEIYVASLLAIDVDNPAERGYLAMLAARLQLDEKLVAHLHATVEGAAQQSGAGPARRLNLVPKSERPRGEPRPLDGGGGAGSPPQPCSGCAAAREPSPACGRGECVTCCRRARRDR